MVKERANGNSCMSHRCGLLCLGPLTFHSQAVGDMVHLSQGCRLAERTESTFKNGLVFSSRTVKVQEKICLRVERDLLTWHGALRVGFTNVPPSARSLPLPCMAIPDLTDSPGHWIAAIHDSYCHTGSELEFWVSDHGSIYVKNSNSRKHKLLSGVDLRKPLWAIIDIYGQTCSIFLLGSEKKGLFFTSSSCPAPERSTSPDVNNLNTCISNVSSIFGSSDECIASLEVPEEKRCVVCMGQEATITLPCGHRCLCVHCTPRIFKQFGTCPLCRHNICDSVENRCASGELPRHQQAAES